MNTSLDDLTVAVLSLSIQDRIELSNRIWDSIDDPHLHVEPMSDSVRAAAEIALRRAEEMSSGKCEGQSHEEVMAKIRQSISPE
jgi:putative addiction module component (TIGR02574 family)